MPPKLILSIGVGLMLLGFALPLLMVVKLITASFFLLFVAWTASVGGMILATLGLFQVLSSHRDSDR